MIREVDCVQSELENSELFRLLVESVKEYAIFALDVEGFVCSWNVGAESLKGYAADEIIGRHFSVFYEPEEVAEGVPTRHLNIARIEGSCESKGWRLKKDGTRFWAKTALARISDADGVLLGYAKVTRDETARVQADASAAKALAVTLESERLLQEAQEIAKIGSWEFDLSSRRTIWSPHLFAILGRELALGENGFEAMFDICHFDHAPLIRAAVDSAISDGIPYAMDLRCSSECGDPNRWIHAIGRPIYDSAGSIVRLAGTVMDISERKSSEERLQSLLVERESANAQLHATEQKLLWHSQELVRSNTDLEHFAYAASHDLQEPLRMVTSFLQLIDKKYKGQLDEQGDRWIDHAVDGSLRMKALIQDLLAYCRVGTHAKEFTKCDVEKVLGIAMKNLELAISESHAKLTHEPLPTVEGEFAQLAGLFQNLIANAIKYCGPRPPSIHISAKLKGNNWLFCVQDTGIGIDPDFADRIFVIFQRLHVRTKQTETGIGLALCKRIVERHGGRIWVESKVGEGSTFYFVLPETQKDVKNDDT